MVMLLGFIHDLGKDSFYFLLILYIPFQCNAVAIFFSVSMSF